LIGSSKVVTIYFHDAHFIFSYFDDTVAMWSEVNLHALVDPI
jgi:hypothetical protein